MANDKDKKRFVVTYEEGNAVFGKEYVVFVDRLTGINYLSCGNAYGTGLTVLLDKDGKPVVTKID